MRLTGLRISRYVTVLPRWVGGGGGERGGGRVAYSVGNEGEKLEQKNSTWVTPGEID